MAGDKPTPKTKPKEEGTPKKKSEAAAKKDTPKKKEKSPAKESKEKEQEPAAEPAAEPAKEEESIAVYMAAGIGEMLHGKKDEDSDDDESNFLERGVNFLGELVDDIKALPDKFSGPEGGRADKTKVDNQQCTHSSCCVCLGTAHLDTLWPGGADRVAFGPRQPDPGTGGPY